MSRNLFTALIFWTGTESLFELSCKGASSRRTFSNQASFAHCYSRCAHGDALSTMPGPTRNNTREETNRRLHDPFHELLSQLSQGQKSSAKPQLFLLEAHIQSRGLHGEQPSLQNEHLRICQLRAVCPRHYFAFKGI